MLSRFYRILANDENFPIIFKENDFYCTSIIQVIEALDDLINKNYKKEFENDTIENIKNNPSIIEKIKNLNYYYSIENYSSPQDENLIKSFIHYLAYQYKHGNLSNFWRDNLLKYFSRYDEKIIKSDPKLSLLFEIFGRMLDRIDELIEKMKNLYDLEKVESEYLNYVSEIFGLHKEDFSITLDDNAFREILKYIKQFYKLKGNAKVYTIFFKLLGYDVEIIQLYWDRDRFFKNSASILNSTLKNDFRFYLTAVDPRKRNYYPVDEKDMQDKKDFYVLNEVTMEMLGITDTYQPGCVPCPFFVENDETHTQYYYLPNSNDQFRYFKTNYIIFKLKLNTSGLTGDSQTILNNYINFFTPINIYADILMVPKPMEDELSNFLKLFINPHLENSEIIKGFYYENYYNAEVTENINSFIQLKNFTNKLDKYNNKESVIGVEEDLYLVNVTNKMFYSSKIDNFYVSNKEKISDTIGLYFIRNGMRTNRKNYYISNTGSNIFIRKFIKYFFFEELNALNIKFKGQNIQIYPYYEISKNNENIYNIECIYKISDMQIFNNILLQEINLPIPPYQENIIPENYKKFLLRANTYQGYLYKYRFIYNGDNEIIKQMMPSYNDMYEYIEFWNNFIFQNNVFKYENALLYILKELNILI